MVNIVTIGTFIKSKIGDEVYYVHEVRRKEMRIWN